MSAYSYVFTTKALKDFQRLPKEIQKTILNKLDYFMNSDQPLTHAHPLINSELGEYRFRIGDYRVVVDRENDIFVVLAVGHRRDIYK